MSLAGRSESTRFESKYPRSRVTELWPLSSRPGRKAGSPVQLWKFGTADRVPSGGWLEFGQSAPRRHPFVPNFQSFGGALIYKESVPTGRISRYGIVQKASTCRPKCLAREPRKPARLRPFAPATRRGRGGERNLTPSTSTRC